MIRTIRIKQALRNAGYSLGLEYPFIYGRIHGVWMVWHRETGVVACRWPDAWESTAMRTCYAMNRIPITGFAADNAS